MNKQYNVTSYKFNLVIIINKHKIITIKRLKIIFDLGICLDNLRRYDEAI